MLVSRKIKIILFVVAFVALGFAREYLFVSINDLLYYKYSGEINPYHFVIEKWLTVFSYNTLYIAKWFITPLSAFIFWFVQKQFLLFLFNEKKTTQWLNVLYATLFVLAGIFFVVGWAFGNIEKGYTFSRLFMGLLQSPVACMILIPITFLYTHQSQNK